MHIGTRIYTWLNGSYVGSDSFGNRYFQERSLPKNRRRKRWVAYKGMVEASKVPANWHGWLHYTMESPPPKKAFPLPWQKLSEPNLTGTKHAYFPGGHLLAKGERTPTASDYQAWKP